MVISYGKLEAESFQYRARLAKGAFKRLEGVLMCRSVPIRFRWHLWKACILPCLFHGLDCVGLKVALAHRLRVLVIGQARRIARSWSMFTHEANDDFMDRHGLQDPVERLQQVHSNRIEKAIPEFEQLQVTEEVQQWRHLLSAQFAEACGGHQLGALDVRIGPTAHLSPAQNVRAKLVPVDLVVEQFLCDKCGFAFASQAALRSHQFRMHFEEGEKEQRHQEIRKQQRRDVYENAKDGMPTCIHCQHQFDSWPAFTYHVNSRSCPEIRKFFGDPELRNALAELPKALL